MSSGGSCALASDWLRLHSRNVPAPVLAIRRCLTRVERKRQAAYAPHRKYMIYMKLGFSLGQFSAGVLLSSVLAQTTRQKT